MPIKQPENTPILRTHIEDLSSIRREVNDSKVAKINRFLWRKNDARVIQEAMVQRYAQYLKTEEDTEEGTIETSLASSAQLGQHKGVALALLNGQQESIALGLFPYLVSWHGLFGEAGEGYLYDNDNASVIPDLRAEGGGGQAAQRWDDYAKAAGCSILYLSVDSQYRLVESAVPINSFYWGFAETYERDGARQQVERDNLDHATVVSMRLEDSLDGDPRWATWYGPSNKYPSGRHCIYSDRLWSSVPDVGSTGCLDYVRGGQMIEGATVDEIANPLSLWAEVQKDYSIPTYPFTPLQGAPNQAGMFPTSFSLYDDVVEFSILQSVLLGMLGKASRGAQVLTRSGSMDSAVIPSNTTEGLIDVPVGQELRFDGKQASDVRAGIEGYNDMLGHLANCAHIPPHMVVPNTGGQVPSGVALEIIMSDARAYRMDRVDSNRANVNRRFEIEKALINATLGVEKIPSATVEVWNPGRKEFPKDPMVQATTWEKRIAANEATIIDMAQDLRQIPTREQAVNFLKEQAKEKEDPELADILKPPVAQNVQSSGGGTVARLREKRGVGNGQKK